MAGTPIDGKPAITTILGTERVAVSAGTDTGGVGAGATDRKMTLDQQKAWIEANFAGVFDSLQFNPQTPAEQPYVLGKMFYDSESHTWTAYTDIPGVSLQLGEELRGRLSNDTGSTLFDGKAVSILAGSGNHFVVELLDASKIDSALRANGIITADIINGAEGYSVKYGIVRDINTNSWEVGDVLWGDPDTPGDLINVRPRGPNYPIRIGTVLIKSATVGSIAVDTLAFNGSDTSVNLDGTLNGIVTETPQVDFSVSGGIIYADVTNEAFPTKNLPVILDGVRYLLDTTTNTGPGGAARIIIPPGNAPSVGDGGQKSWIYITLNVGVPELGVSTSKPAVQNAGICTVVAFDAATTLANGNKPQMYRRENNASDSLTEGIVGSYGFTRVLADDVRSRGSAWDSGQDPTTTVNDTNILLALSAGIGKQLHYSNVPAFDGLNYQIYNNTANLTTYASETNLVNIVTDAAGGTLLGNGYYYTFRFYYKLNSNGIGNDVIVTRPLGHYETGSAAEADALKYTVILSDTKIEDIVYPLYEMVIVRTGTGGGLGLTVNLYSIKSLRSKTPGVGGGAGGEGVTTDDKIRISADDTTNSYGEDKFVAGTGITRTILNPAGNEQIEFKNDHTLPASSTDNAIARYDGTTGKILQNSSIIIDDLGNVTTEGTSAIDGTTPIYLRIKDLQNSSSWTVGAEMMSYEFYSNDTSGIGVGVKAKISAICEDIFGAKVGIGIYVTDGSTISLGATINHLGKLALINSPTTDTTFLPPLVRDTSTGEIKSADLSYTALTAGAAVSYDLTTGMHRTLNVAVDTTITFSNMATAAKNPFGDIRLNVTVISSVILAGTGVTFKGIGTLTSLPVGVYHLVFTVISATEIDYTINSSEPYA